MNKFNNMSNSNSIFEQVSTCSYPTNSKDYIGSVILELYNLNKSTKFFKVVKDGDKILVAQFKISVLFKGKTYEVPVLIYLPKLFPKISPEVYIEAKSDTGINPKNKDIDQKSKKISLGSLRAWNNYSTLKGVIADIECSFNKEFPIYKISIGISQTINSKDDYSYLKVLEECFLDNRGNINTNSNTNINSNYNQNNNINWSNMYSNNNLGLQNNSNNQVFSGNSNVNENSIYYNNPGNLTINNISTSQPKNYNIDYNKNFDNLIGNQQSYINNNLKINYKIEIKKKIIDELKKSLEIKLKDEVIQIKQQNENLINFKKELLLLKEKYIMFFNSKNLIENNMLNKKNLMNDEIIKLKLATATCRDNILTQYNYEKFIDITGKDLLKVCAVEATMEDILIVMKKGFDKGIVGFDETVKLYREFSKELVKVKFYKEKIGKLINQK